MKKITVLIVALLCVASNLMAAPRHHRMHHRVHHPHPHHRVHHR